MPYLANSHDWDNLAYEANRPEYCGARFGLDTETYGHNVRESSPAHRARVDVWSVGFPTPNLAPRGFHKYVGYVLPEAALQDPGIRAWLGRGRFVLHNAGHDRHALARYGIALTDVVDTLERARLLWPGRTTYGLKALRVDLLGKAGRDGYKWLTRPEEVVVGVVQSGPNKGRWKMKKVACPMEEIGPGHERWEDKVYYAAEDAVDAPELAEVCDLREAELARRLPVSPW